MRSSDVHIHPPLLNMPQSFNRNSTLGHTAHPPGTKVYNFKDLACKNELCISHTKHNESVTPYFLQVEGKMFVCKQGMGSLRHRPFRTCLWATFRSCCWPYRKWFYF